VSAARPEGAASFSIRRIALRSLAHDRGKLAGSLAGVAFAATLLLIQIGLYAGFIATSSALITQAGGDVWVMARGTEVLENGEPLSAGTRASVASHPCVAHVRGMVVAFAATRKAGGAPDSVQLIGYEPGTSPIFPWTLLRGLPQDLHAPNRVAIDAFDVPKLQIEGDPLGAHLEMGGQAVYVAAITEDVRSFTLQPNVFAEVETARRLARLSEGQVSYWIVDLHSPSCAPDVIATIERHEPDVQALTKEGFSEKTQDYWVFGSGAGSALGFSAILGLVVGTVIVGQTLYAITKEHLRELGTLKAIGATNGELIGFVAWQAAFLALIGGGVGLLIALIVQRAVTAAGLLVVLSPSVLATGAAAILWMCAVASISSVRKVIRLEAAEVFK
jgi:putative ABC transport system permease protein